MSRKSIVMIGLFVGSTIGGFLPVLWGASVLSYWSIFGNAIGGIIGIWIAFRMTE
jgi:hypothetical protein